MYPYFASLPKFLSAVYKQKPDNCKIDVTKIYGSEMQLGSHYFLLCVVPPSISQMVSDFLYSL